MNTVKTPVPKNIYLPRARLYFGNLPVNQMMGVTIFVSCMGLFGHGLFRTRRRAKEIGIRKVLGASVGTIATMLSRDFVVLVGLAFCIATPLAWWATQRPFYFVLFRLFAGGVL